MMPWPGLLLQASESATTPHGALPLMAFDQ